jgi:Protein of unknown function (DUF3443)/Abnormal spindle-like microcephaly-assoc'd, ASPM-SPD-2-Hydin
MKIALGRATLVLVAAFFIGTGVLAQRESDAATTAAKAPIAHIAFSRRSIAFGLVKVATTKSLSIRNTGALEANVAVTSPTAPFNLTAGGGSYVLAPGVSTTIGVEFAPTAKGPVKAEIEIQCSNCNSAADDNAVIHLRGDAEGPVAAPIATPTPMPGATPTPSSANALPMSVTTGPFDSVDQPFASVTICVTGTSNCTTVNDVLIDTGSFGLRIFGSQINGLPVTPNTEGGSDIGECAFFGSGSTWGSVSTVDVTIAGEPTITIPIQVVDDIDAFTPAPHECTQGSQLLSSPQVAGFYGILGVGSVSNDTIFTDYFECSGGTCSSLESPPNADIVQNPVSSLPVDNNGVVVSLPSIPAAGEPSTNGTLYFGIGTESNNEPGAVMTYQQNSDPNSVDYLKIETVYKGSTAGGFFDTGSNGYFFNDASITECSDDLGFYCPVETVTGSATNQSVGTAVSGVVNFQISNADSLFGLNDAALDNLGGPFDGSSVYDGFDWGLPFFFGRSVYLGILGKSSSLGTGPYAAY